jgi:hypothetical protein
MRGIPSPAIPVIPDQVRDRLNQAPLRGPVGRRAPTPVIAVRHYARAASHEARGSFFGKNSIMAKVRKAPLWRGRFLRALARTGNVTASAEAAGVDKSTVYLRRKGDRGFARRWEKALANAKAAVGMAGAGPLHRPPAGPCSGRPAPRAGLSRAGGGSPEHPRSGVELIPRRTKHGTKLVRVAEGRWCAAMEAKITAELARTGSYRAAARAGAISTRALSNRRKNDPALAARLAAAEARAIERLPGLLAAAAIASFDPEVEDEGLAKVDVAQAIAIVRMKGHATSLGTGGGGRNVPPEPSIEEVREEVMRRVRAIRRHRER